MHHTRPSSLTPRNARRRGYALMAVLMFSMLFMLLLGVASRHVASVMRIATVRAGQTERDQGSALALAEAIERLESGFPTSGSSYAVAVTTASGPRTYTVLYEQQVDTTWNITARPKLATENPSALPDTFAY